MGVSRKCVVVVPGKKIKKKTAFPTVYLLHGYGGSYDNWIKLAPVIRQIADDYQMIIVCPDGATNSWYIDSPIDSSYKYETYVAKEVPAYIDAHYPTLKNRKFRAISGLSMGGHGGLFLGWRHADFFSATGSMSGVVDLSSSTQRYELSKRIGDTVNYKSNWENYSVVNLVERKPSDSLAVIFDCGTKDVFIEQNRALHAKMLRLNITHDYTERPGGHDWNYWLNAVQHQLLFFRNHFERMKQAKI